MKATLNFDILVFQRPDFGDGADAKAMEKRMQVFECKTIPNCRPGYDVMYTQRAMEIIHWMAEKLHDVPLFDDADVGTSYDDQVPILNRSLEPISVPDFTTSDLTNLRYVDETILPQRTVLRAYLDAYDHHGDVNCPPFRITSKAYALDSLAYHRSVYLNIRNPFESVNLDEGIDVEALFSNRKEQGWRGMDSLYHAWLLVNFRRTPSQFKMKEFAARFPDWKKKMLPSMDLSPRRCSSPSTELLPGCSKTDGRYTCLLLWSHSNHFPPIFCLLW